MMSLSWKGPRWLEPAAFGLLAAVLLIRFPIHFALSDSYLMTFEVYRGILERLLADGPASLYLSLDGGGSFFKYAPLWALVWMPLGWLPSPVGSALWTTGSVACLLATLLLCGRLCRRQGILYHPLTAVLSVLILVRPLTSELLNGQVNLLWGLLTVGFVYLSLTERPWRAALCLALAISLKLPALIFLAYLIVRRQWQMAGRTSLWLFGLNIAGAVALLPGAPWRLFQRWQEVLLASGPDRAFEIGNQSLFALVGRFVRDGGYGFNLLALSDGMTGLVTLGIGTAIFAALVWPRPPTTEFGGGARHRLVLDGAMLTVCMVLFSPTCWVTTYSALFFPVFLAVGLFTGRPRTTWRHGSLALGALAATLLSGMTHQKLWRLVGITRIGQESYVYLVLTVLPWLGLATLWYLWHHRRIAVRPLS